jgi:type IV secretion system protein VirB1
MDFLALASDCASFVNPQTLEAIVKTESNYQPFSIGVNGGFRLERQPVNLEEAVVTAQWLLNCWRALNFDHSFALNFDQGWRAG